MERNAMKRLIKWHNDIERKPLIIKGARQVGKTWLMKEFGRRYYKNYVYFNFDEENSLASIFENNKNPHRIIELLSIISEIKIQPKDTLIILDEIQECSAALNTLKYFKEKANEYHIIVAGSLLGTLLSQPQSYPVGMVNMLYLAPLSFDEFLSVVDDSLYNYYLTISKNTFIEEIFHHKLLEVFDYYLMIGGMPESVNSWMKYKDMKRIKMIQKELIDIYENDFTKHNSRINSIRVLMVFRSLITQLAKNNGKFVYSNIKEGARAREFEEAIEWLVSAGMINRIYNVSKIEQPLAVFKKINNFKLYLFDTGLLKEMAEISDSLILLNEPYQFKGSLIENYVLQQLLIIFDHSIHYYDDNNSEIDFLLQDEHTIIPIEVKAGENKSAISFKNYIKKSNAKKAIRFSRMGYRTDGNITNIPLYLVSKTRELI